MAGPEIEGQANAGEPRGRSPLPYLVAALVIALAAAAGLGGYLVGDRSGADVEGARLAGQREGEAQVAATRVPASRLRKAKSEGRRTGYRRAYRAAFRGEKRKALAAAPKHCGDARANDTPVIVKVRAEAVGCAAALALARQSTGCTDLPGACGGYQCSAVETGYESSEITCVNGRQRVRWVTAV